MIYTMQLKKLFAFFAIALLFSFAAAPAEAQRGPRQEKLLNGLRVLMWPNPAADTVELKLRIHAGASFDPQGREGTMKMLAESLATGSSLPERYHRLFRIWFILGWPAFIGLVVVFFLMVVKPV